MWINYPNPLNSTYYYIFKYIFSLKDQEKLGYFIVKYMISIIYTL